jgi:glycosyltransferase involved in cell wall biosynthesis/CMP-N-acetylneuraminic acid synthetase
MPVTPRMTVYIPSHNYGKFLEAAIESVLRQTATDWELLLINDGSTDNTSHILSMYKGDPRVRTFTTRGIGLPAVCNLALREARGRYLIRLDGDDIFDEDILLVLGHRLDADAELALVFPDYYLIDEQGDVFAHEQRERLYSADHVLDVPANGACTLTRSDVLRDVGGWREDLGVQDGYDLWSKICKRYKVANVNLPLFFYRRHGENLTGRVRHILAAHREIKRDNALEKIDSFRPLTAFIPCRRNYDFHADVWKLPVNGCSLLERNIDKCLASPLFDNVLVASDNEEVRDILGGFHDPRLLFASRNLEETRRSSGLAPSLAHALKSSGVGLKGTTILSYLQAPFVSTATLEESLTTLVLHGANCAIGVQEIRDPLFRRGSHGLVPINPARSIRSGFDTVYREANIAFALGNCNLLLGSIMGPFAVHFQVPADECFFINSKQSWRIADILDNHT